MAIDSESDNSEGRSKEEAKALLEEYRLKIAESFPDALTFDLENPDDRLALVLLAAMTTGTELSIVSGNDSGREESITISPIDNVADGEQLVEFQFDSTDGKLSDDTAGLATELIAMSADLDAEAALLKD